MILRTGDTECEFWLEASGGRSYLCAVSSRRRGVYGSKRWQRPTFRWYVETWLTENGPEPRASKGICRTFAEAMRKVRHVAAALEAKR